jgi:hypothetical protein
MLDEHERRKGAAPIARMVTRRGCAFDPEVIAVVSFAFSAVFAEVGLSDRDVARRAASHRLTSQVPLYWRLALDWRVSNYIEISMI